MPLYEYQCDACGKRFEKIQKFSDPPLDRCELCARGPVHKLLSSPAIQFKGSGWYITDYAKKGGTSDGDSKSSAESTKTDSSEKPAAKSDTPAAKSDTAAAKADAPSKSSP